jgi:hypothetical protein
MQLLCAENLFAFRPNQTCLNEAVTPKSGLYIDDLEFISLAAMSQLGKHTYATAQQALESKTNEAINWLHVSLQSQLLQLGYVVPQQEPPVAYGNYLDTLASPSLQPRGMVVQRMSGCSPLSVLYIQSVQYKGAASENITIQIRSFQGGVLGAVLDSFTVFANADLGATVLVDKRYSVDVAIVSTPSGAPYNTGDACGCIQLCARHGAALHRHKSLTISGYDGAAIEKSNTYGITICAAVQCYLPAVICHVLPTLYFSLRYRVAELLLGELAALSAPTDFTASFINTEQLAALRKNYADKADKAEKVAIYSMIENLRRTDKLCISCDNPAAVKVKSMV